MMALTERYDVEHIDPLCDGWQFGLGVDTRLNRQVLITLIPIAVADQPWFLQWLQKRSVVSHPYVAELLDGERINKSFLCVFARPEKVQIGLPSLHRSKIYESAEQIIQGIKALQHHQIYFSFSAGQVLWDGAIPQMLGLPNDNSYEDIVAKEDSSLLLAHYILNLLEWNESFEREHDHPLPAYLKPGLQSLEEFTYSNADGLSELSKILAVLQMDEENWLTTSQMEDTFIEQLPEPNVKTVTASPFRGWLLLAVLIIVIMAGFIWWFGRGVSSNLINNQGLQVSTNQQPKTGKSNKFIMPNLTGASIQVALLKLMSLGVKNNQEQVITQSVNTTDGKIISTNPLPKHALTKGEKVVLVVGVLRGDLLVPDLNGLSLSKVTHQLMADHIHYSYTYKNAPLQDQGEVIAQSPQSYSIVSNSTPVQFVVGAHY